VAADASCTQRTGKERRRGCHAPAPVSNCRHLEVTYMLVTVPRRSRADPIGQGARRGVEAAGAVVRQRIHAQVGLPQERLRHRRRQGGQTLLLAGCRRTTRRPCPETLLTAPSGVGITATGAAVPGEGALQPCPGRDMQVVSGQQPTMLLPSASPSGSAADAPDSQLEPVGA